MERAYPVSSVRPFHRPLLGAFACLVLLAVTGVLALLVPGVRLRDERTLDGFVALERPRTEPVADFFASLANPLPFAVIGLVLIAVAALRGRWAVAVAVPVVMVGSGVTTQVLKMVIEQPRYAEALGSNQISDGAWPSGHATASMALALCLVLVMPARLRPLAALTGGAFAVAVSYAILTLGWHFPSDVMGGYLVATVWALVAVAALEAVGARRSTASPPVGRIVAAGIAGGAAWLGAAALARPEAALEFAADHPSALAGGAALALTAVALSAGLARALRV
jgi:membrane-associated phospholipid phosphatase